jgi:cytochrome c556
MRTGFYTLLAASAVALTGVALGADDPVAARLQLMKENGAASKVVSSMVKGRTPFDATAAASALNKIAADMVTFPSLFPPGSDKAPKTTASPDIFTNMDDFKALAAKLGTDAKAAADAAATSPDALAAAFNLVSQDCAACHRKYRTE